ncbi:MAG: Transposase domain protein [Gemmataceae bacterium]|nr:Transposase domain protein [Gemmataceae bacterium]
MIVRQHRRTLPCRSPSRLKACGGTDTGTVCEPRVRVTDPDGGGVVEWRRIEVRLVQETREGDRRIALSTNLPEDVPGLRIAELYRDRWAIETRVQFLTRSLHCEVSGLGRPRAASFAFAMALVAGNALATVRGTGRSVHGVEAEEDLPGYYLADEVAADYRTLMKYLPADQWTGWRRLPAQAVVGSLRAVARHVNLKGLARGKRGPKKPPPKNASV